MDQGICAHGRLRLCLLGPEDSARLCRRRWHSDDGMSHCLIFGMTESGKTTLAKRLAQRYRYHEVKVIVLDSLNDPGWSADFQTTDPDEFLQVFWESRRCAIFIDEAGDAVGKYNTVMQRTATRGR